MVARPSVADAETLPNRGTDSMAKQSLVKEFVLFIKYEKKWWLIPLLAVLLLVAGIMVFAAQSPLAPFIYPFL